jgi:hypothetical protein
MNFKSYGKAFGISVFAGPIAGRCTLRMACDPGNMPRDMCGIGRPAVAQERCREKKDQPRCQNNRLKRWPNEFHAYLRKQRKTRPTGNARAGFRAPDLI